MQQKNLQNNLSINYILLFPILPLLNYIFKLKNIPEVIILNKHPNIQFKMIFQFF